MENKMDQHTSASPSASPSSSSFSQSKQLSDLILEQQCPTDTKSETNINKIILDGEVNNQAAQLAIESCHCPHLREYFPYILDLTLCKSKSHPRGWIVSNPVHALHVVSQLDDFSPVSLHSKDPPPLFGEEQQRTTILSTEGVVDSWCPMEGLSAFICNPVSTSLHSKNIYDTTTKSGTATGTSSSNTSNSKSQRKEATKASKSTVPQSSSKDSRKDKNKDGATSKKDSTSAQAQNVLVPKEKTPKNNNDPLHVPSSSVSKVKNDTSISSTVTFSDAVVSSPSVAKTSTKDVDTAVAPSQTLTNKSDRAVAVDATSTTATTASTAAAVGTAPAANGDSSLYLSGHRFHQLRLEEDRIRMIRKSMTSKRINSKNSTNNNNSKKATTKKRKREIDIYKAPGVPGWKASPTKHLTDETSWEEAASVARLKVELWMENFRSCRQSYWENQKHLKSALNQHEKHTFWNETGNNEVVPCCLLCSAPTADTTKTAAPAATTTTTKTSKKKRKPVRMLVHDDFMQCLDCTFVGCAPSSISPGSRQHILQHMLVTGHTFAISFGKRSHLFCFKCGDFVYHPVFDAEEDRIQYASLMPSISWKEHRVQRSFNPLHFLRTAEHGIIWRGLRATYPPLVPKVHINASKLVMRRQALFEGRVNESWLLCRPLALSFCAHQALQEPASRRWNIIKPVGMYNLGNTCFQNAILQCLVHCSPLQRYFLKDLGHHHLSCKEYRKPRSKSSSKKHSTSGSNKDSASIEQHQAKSSSSSSVPESICLACRMDELFLTYYGSTIGKDVIGSIQTTIADTYQDSVIDRRLDRDIQQGEPILTSDLLTAAWKSGGMNHLAGYEQRDAHEFLSSFLDLMGKHSLKHYERISQVTADGTNTNSATKAHQNIIKDLFGGSLRSLLVCEECGSKRTLHEPFFDVSLTLSEKLQQASSTLSVEQCLKNFTLPENLSDAVHCPSCDKKTKTKKQHTFSKLPKILCLHLKRFDAAQNKKMEDFVSFPARGLNMGPFLPHWCEIPRIKSEASGSTIGTNYNDGSTSVDPLLTYDLFGTVNHVGTLQSGHYAANVKVNGTWYYCNDSHISKAGPGTGENEVVKSDGAYILFYIRR